MLPVFHRLRAERPGHRGAGAEQQSAPEAARRHQDGAQQVLAQDLLRGGQGAAAHRRPAVQRNRRHVRANGAVNVRRRSPVPCFILIHNQQPTRTSPHTHTPIIYVINVIYLQTRNAFQHRYTATQTTTHKRTHVNNIHHTRTLT